MGNKRPPRALLSRPLYRHQRVIGPKAVAAAARHIIIARPARVAARSLPREVTPRCFLSPALNEREREGVIKERDREESVMGKKKNIKESAAYERAEVIKTKGRE